MTLVLLAVVAVLGVDVAGIRREAGTVCRQTQLASSADRTNGRGPRSSSSGKATTPS